METNGETECYVFWHIYIDFENPDIGKTVVLRQFKLIQESGLLEYCQKIYIGVNALDYSGYPDCRPEFIKAFEDMANLATKQSVEGEKIEIKTPLISMTKAEIIQKGLSLGVDYSQTISCYLANSNGEACGKCDACVLRINGFNNANIKDPTFYQ